MSFAEKYLDLMLCVLMADGVIHEKEKALFYEMLDNSGINEKLRAKYENIMSGNIPAVYDELLSRIAKEADLAQLPIMVKDAYLMASIDDNVDESEIVTINKFLKDSGIPESRFDAIQKWALESVEHLKRGKSLFTK